MPLLRSVGRYNVDVSAPLLITQAFLGLHDTGVGGGQSTAIETLSNGITLRLDTPGSIILNANDASSLPPRSARPADTYLICGHRYRCPVYHLDLHQA
jgi:hypothetical protein